MLTDLTNENLRGHQNCECKMINDISAGTYNPEKGSKRNESLTWKVGSKLHHQVTLRVWLCGMLRGEKCAERAS
jgi:hypothetical protein